MMTVALALHDAAQIRYVTNAEAERLARVELDRMLALLDSLDDADWSKPTACVKWSVRDMLAHQAGAYASGTGYGQMIHQYTAVLKPGQPAEDSINERQLADRAGRSPQELIAELRRSGEPAVRNWAHGFRLVKPFGIPHPIPGWLGLRHLMLVVHSRDTWIHRLDICLATGRSFEQTPEHDGRIVELVVLDLAKTLAKKLDKRALVLDLDGISGGRWQLGPGEPEATIRMDSLDFSVYASGRMTLDEATRYAIFSGDRDLAGRAFRNFNVLY